ECSTFLWKDGRRKDYVAITGHDRHLRKDYQRVQELGIQAVREGIRWPLVDKGAGRYDWSTVTPVLEAARACRLTILWDLCHFGLPHGFDPFSDTGARRYAAYCRVAAEIIVAQCPAPRFFTPINEITFFSGAGTDMGWMYPFAKGRLAEFKQALCRLAIAGVEAIRQVDPGARMVHVDPLIYEVPAEADPALARQAWEDTYQSTYEAWDMLSGRLHPELGGAPEILDILGVNVYSHSEARLLKTGQREGLRPDDPRRKPLRELLQVAWERYRRPMIIGETSGYQDTRAAWLDQVMEEVLAARAEGIDMQGVCLYPFVDIPEWQSQQPAKIGVYDVREDGERVPCAPYIEAILRWQRVLE
ncbi:MAG TPA: hypothetical protein VKT32_01375, partial [Chthonomonadaceae bacterium]|nr:hypothetical protein [Chthonomonadaceae bacterium]